MSAVAWAVRDLRSLSGERERSELLARKDTVELACREGEEQQRGELERAELGRGCSENSIIRVAIGVWSTACQTVSVSKQELTVSKRNRQVQIEIATFGSEVSVPSQVSSWVG